MKIDKNVITFNSNSNEYNKSRPTYPDEVFQIIYDNCQGHGRAWDCACGSGQVSKSLVKYYKEIYATDISPNQLDYAINHNSIKYSLQPSEKTIFSKNSFDLVCVAQAIHWFDLTDYFKEVKRVLKYNGLFACFGYSFFKIDPEIDKIFKTEIFTPLEPYWSEKNKILINGYKDIDFPFKKIEIPKVDMFVYWSKLELLNYIKTWSAFKLFEKEDTSDIINNLMRITEEIWPIDIKKKINMDFIFYLGQNVDKRGLKFEK